MGTRTPDESPTTEPEAIDRAVVVLPSQPTTYQGPCIKPSEIQAIVCHCVKKRDEHYLVQWRVAVGYKTAYSWHNLNELRECLGQVQKYLDKHVEQIPTKKRKTPDDERARLCSPASSVTSSSTQTSHRDLACYFCKLSIDIEEGHISVSPEIQSNGTIGSDQDVPWDFIKQRASTTPVQKAQYRIRQQFLQKVDAFNARFGRLARLQLENVHDEATPSLDFSFIEKSVLGQNVFALDPETILGCGVKRSGVAQVCRPDMGQGIGCEYTRVCECMEFAAVDDARLSEEDKAKMERDNSRIDLPKRFPYSQKKGHLVNFYLRSRHCIYECNSRCACGPGCKSRQVQKGRRIPLEIFRTGDGRGWGLRTQTDLEKGQFVDTYRGEIITNEEADLREEKAQAETGKIKNSYFFSLDKHVGEMLDADDCYVVDGEHMGGPTRFINHSCEPNCQMHTVSMNKFDARVYELAFFTNEAIRAGTELTFDYMDKDGEDVEAEDLPQPGEGQPCRCGSANCRKWLWL